MPGWFADHLTSTPPDSTSGWFSSLIPKPPPKSNPTLEAWGLGGDYHPLRALRQALGGVAEGAAEVPGQLAALGRFLAPPALPDAVSGGSSTTAPAPTLPQRIGDVVGGPQKTASDSGSRAAGNLAGQLAGWELGSRTGLLSKLAPSLKTIDITPPAAEDIAARPDGFTYDPRKGTFVTSGGYMVGGVPGQKGHAITDVTPEAVQKFADDNQALLAKPGMMMGGWRNGEDGKFYLDVSQQEPDKAKALDLLKARGEKAAWHLDSGTELVNPHANGAVSAGAVDIPAPGQQTKGMPLPDHLPTGTHDPSKPLYLRVGDWNPKHEYSGNNATGQREAGLSAYDLNGLEPTAETLDGDWVEQDLRDRMKSDAPKYYVQGDHVGTGGDGEPLLRNTRVVGMYGEPLPTPPKRPDVDAGLRAPNLLGLNSERDVIPLDVSIDPAGVDASRPAVLRPPRADLSVLEGVKRRIRDVYTPAAEKGLKENPLGAAWYDLSPLKRLFQEESPTGAEDFNMFTSLLGPTSAGTDVPQNIRQASLFYKLWKEGQLTPEAIRGKQLDIPAGYGNRLNIREPLARVVEQGQLDPLRTPKTFRFSQQLGGKSWGGTALDRHVGYNVGLLGSFDDAPSAAGSSGNRGFPSPSYPTDRAIQTSPTDTHYAAIEDAMIREAEKLGVHPAAYQAAGWVGNAEKTHVTDARHPLEIINGKLEETAKRYGYASRMAALRAFIRGQTPLWALGGLAAGAGGGLLSEDGPPDEGR